VQALLAARGLKYVPHPFPNPQQTRDPRPEGRNLIIDLPGMTGREIIVGAHLDAAPLSGGGFSHGMVDNGAGVVVLTRLAEALGRGPRRHRIRIVFFDMEENGLAGSRAFAATIDRTRVDAMVNIDIAGYGDTVLAGPSTTAGAAPLFRAFARVCGAEGHQCIPFAVYPLSDDRSFSAAGVPSISLGVLPALEAHQIWLTLNGGKDSGLVAGFAPPILRTIHTSGDTADKLTPAGMTLIYNVVLGLVREIDRL
jgi:Zn-dependent M28 family amino/carboxypeptidase